MRLTVLGRSPARPNPGEACAGYLVEDGRARVRVDIGHGIVGQLLLVQRPGQLDAVIVNLSEHDGSTPFDVGSLTVTPRATQHYIPCWGFRIEGDGRRLAYTADTAPCEGLDDLADGADLLLSEATLRSLADDAQPPEPRGHLTPAEAGMAARDGGAGCLVLTHLPVNGDDGAWARTDAEAAFGSAVRIAEPGRTYEV